MGTINFQGPIINLFGNLPSKNDVMGAWAPGTLGLGIGIDGSNWLIYYMGSSISSVELST